MLLPGAHGTTELFAPLQAAVDGPTDAIALEPDAPIPYEALVPWIRTRLPDTPFVLVAESYSVPAAILLGGEDLPHLRGLVLSGGFVRAPRRLLRWVPWALLLRAPKPSWAIRRYVVGRDASDELCAAVRRAVGSPGRLARRMREVARCDVGRQFAALTRPILWLHGRHDRMVPPRVPDRRPQGLRTALLDGPHLLLQARPGACGQAIRSFVGDLTQADPGLG